MDGADYPRHPHAPSMEGHRVADCLYNPPVNKLNSTIRRLHQCQDLMWNRSKRL